MYLALILVPALLACGGRGGPVATSVNPFTPLATDVVAPATSAWPSSSAPSSSAAPAATPSVPPVGSAFPTLRAPAELIVVELTTGARFHVQTAPAARDVGHFVYSLPGRGSYSGFADKGLRVSASDVVVDYTGPATFIASTLASPTATAAPVLTVSVHLEAAIDSTTRTGAVTLTHDGHVFAMTAAVPSVADLDPVMLTFERATVAGDPVGLYSVLNSDVTSAYTPATFAQQWTAQQAQKGTVAALRRLSTGSPKLADFGFWLVVVEYEADEVSPAGAHRTVRYDAYFVRERVGWKVLSTTAR